MKPRTVLRVVLLAAAAAGFARARAWWAAQPQARPGLPSRPTAPSVATPAVRPPDRESVPPVDRSPAEPPAAESPAAEPPAAEGAAVPEAVAVPVEELPAQPSAAPSPAEAPEPAPVEEPAVAAVVAVDVTVAPETGPADEPSAAQAAGGQLGQPVAPGQEWDAAEVKSLAPQLSKRAVRLADALAAAPLPVPASRLAAELGVTREAVTSHAEALNRTAATTRPHLPAPVQQHGTPAKPRYALDSAFAVHWPPTQT